MEAARAMEAELAIQGEGDDPAARGEERGPHTHTHYYYIHTPTTRWGPYVALDCQPEEPARASHTRHPTLRHSHSYSHSQVALDTHRVGG